MPLDPQARFVLDQIAAQGGLELDQLSPAEARQAFEKMRVPLPGEPVARSEDRRVPGPAGEIPVRVYAPDGIGEAAPAVAFFHGGGWVIGSLDTHDGACRALANARAPSSSRSTTGSPPSTAFPAAAEDCYAALTLGRRAGPELGVDPARLAVAGDSAGGNLAAVVSLMARDRGARRCGFQLLVYPVADSDFERASYRRERRGLPPRPATRCSWFWNHYLPERRAAPHRLCVPAARRRRSPASRPRTVITAEYDPLRDEGEAYAARLRQRASPTTCTRYDGQIHGFVGLFEVLDQGRRATEQVAETLREALD